MTGPESENLSVILKPGHTAIEQDGADAEQRPHTDVHTCEAIFSSYKYLAGSKPPEATEQKENELATMAFRIDAPVVLYPTLRSGPRAEKTRNREIPRAETDIENARL